MTRLQFVKMHGLGNDYVYVDGYDASVQDPGAVSRQVSDRHRGVGSDGLILLLPPVDGGDVRMRMFNADGSEAEMCGNGVRCLARLAIERGRATGPDLTIETGAGHLRVQCGSAPADPRGSWDVSVDMGRPIREPAAVPVLTADLAPAGDGAWWVKPSDDTEALACRFVSMGNPHAVAFVDAVADVDLGLIGPQVERHAAFPRRINVHVVTVHSPQHVEMRTWERGAGMTEACGTGACAVAVAAIDAGLTDRRVRTTLPGGDLDIHWPDDGAAVVMRGPATHVFEGHVVVDG
ncbi:MAG: diaminopimelate epimerase [Phycisphaerales bacterium]